MKTARFWILFTALAALGASAQAPRTAEAQQPTAQPRQTPAPARPQDEAEDQTTVTRVVRVPVTVIDKKTKKPVVGLTRNDFMVFEDKRPVQFDFLGELKELEKLPIYVGVLMDTSGSTSGKLKFEQEAAINFVFSVTRTRRDHAAFVTFDDEVNLRQDFTKNQDLLVKAIQSVRKPGAQTSLYDAVWLICDEKMRGVNSPRRALVVITDGDDTYSRARLDDAIQIAQQTDTIIFAVSTKGGFSGSAVPGVEAGTVKDSGDKSLQRLAEETGGRAFYTGDMLALERAFKQIGEELRSQYLLTYKPEGPFDGSLREIEVKLVDADGKRVNAKRGYRIDREPPKQ
ncbi:MAG TPA: VWA domain-containing protein [Pyrinomonadaceae bacterium]|nr:VWA domain-containing protein [Pyrinomonadaceae bacterium]